MLLWFRNDLRTHDNPALHYFIAHTSENSQRKALFFISKEQWKMHDWSSIKIDFFIRHAKWLKKALTHYNIELEIVESDNFFTQQEFLKQYCLENHINVVVANAELEVNEQARDKAIRDSGLTLTLFESDVIVPKGALLNKSGQMYKVFTPFKRAWLSYVKEHGFEYLGELPSTCGSNSIELNNPDKTPPEDTTQVLSVDHFDEEALSKKWPLAHIIEKTYLHDFLSHKLTDYEHVRDIPSVKGTSGLSPYLAMGGISPRYIFQLLLLRAPDILIATDLPQFCWLNELIWREFYRHLMFHEQRLCKHQMFNTKYQHMKWHSSPELFHAWCEGKTGYPLVDAAMRQLNQTGWMHNRLRMVVASFLTKHLLVDWRLGERYFMENLIDGDLAANNGGWQWAASTGCDAQPYFRIFNPIRQSERFDPNGDFIRKYLPELQDLPNKEVHFPHKYIKQQSLNIYWPAIVEHKEARLNAIAFYK